MHSVYESPPLARLRTCHRDWTQDGGQHGCVVFESVYELIVEHCTGCCVAGGNIV